MIIPTEPIGSIPRPLKLLDAITRYGSSHPSLEPLYEEAVRDTIEQLEAIGSLIVTDGEQRKYQNFATYCVDGLPNTAPDGFKLPFAAGHTRRLPRLTGGPFRFLMFGYDYLDLGAVVATLAGRRAGLHVVVTGRNAKPALIEAADLVTEMSLVKHHFAAGVKAQEGIEF